MKGNFRNEIRIASGLSPFLFIILEDALGTGFLKDLVKLMTWH